jgi:hypothetical protein
MVIAHVLFIEILHCAKLLLRWLRHAPWKSHNKGCAAPLGRAKHNPSTVLFYHALGHPQTKPGTHVFLRGKEW